MAPLDESHQDVEGSRANLRRLPIDQQLPSLRLNNKPAETTLDQCIHASKIQRRSTGLREVRRNRRAEAIQRSISSLPDSRRFKTIDTIPNRDSRREPALQTFFATTRFPAHSTQPVKNQNVRKNYMKSKL